MGQREKADRLSMSKGIRAKNGGTTMQCLNATRRQFLVLQLLVVGLCAAFVASPSFGQVGGATLSGTVSDTSGAILPNAQISIKDVSTGLVRTVTADSDGLYTAPNLLPGKYEITVSAAGFATLVRTGVVLTIGGQQVQNIQLQVGQVAQKVEVTSQSLDVELANPTISASVDSTTVRELPLNGRDWTQLATLQPGVLSDAAEQDSSITVQRGLRGYGAQLSIDGNRPQQNDYRLDGISINDY